MVRHREKHREKDKQMDYRDYRKHSQFAAAYAEQQMLDRDAGKLEFAIHAQQLAAYHAAQARFYAEKISR